jgi:molybdopterin synthase catalytic subunit
LLITVRYFATLKDLAGISLETVDLEAGSTVEGLKVMLAQRHERLGQALPTALVAVNREFAFPEDQIQDGDEVALFPPVSGGSDVPPATIVQVTEDIIDLDRILQEITLPTTGASCMFSGMVRAITQRDQQRHTDHLEYEAYREMAEEKMVQVAHEMRDQWPQVEGIAIVQRIGFLAPGTPTVVIACTAGHRDSGVFEAARYGIDRLKQIVPIWKKEVGPDGEVWIEGSYLPDAGDHNP